MNFYRIVQWYQKILISLSIIICISKFTGAKNVSEIYPAPHNIDIYIIIRWQSLLISLSPTNDLSLRMMREFKATPVRGQMVPIKRIVERGPNGKLINRTN